MIISIHEIEFQTKVVFTVEKKFTIPLLWTQQKAVKNSLHNYNDVFILKLPRQMEI